MTNEIQNTESFTSTVTQWEGRQDIGFDDLVGAGKKMVEYAIAGMDNNLFVSTYLLQLPDKSLLEQFIKDNKQ